MSAYLPQIEYTTKYENDDVSVKMTPLDRGSWLKLVPALETVRGAQSTEQTIAVYETACQILEKHLESITGLRDRAGNAISKDVVLSHVYFVDLVNELFAKLVESSSVGKARSAGSEGKSPESSTARA
ncbi:MAG TPA: hypothetical protein VF161_06290 [Steroidobacteraceae bacterium]